MERSPRCAFLYLLLGFFHSLVVPLQWEAGHLRLGSLLVGNRCAPAGASLAPAFRLGVSRTHRIATAHHGKASSSLFSPSCSAADSRQHGAECSGLRALAGRLYPAGEARVRLSWSVLRRGRPCLLPELPRSAVRRSTPTVEMAYWRNARRQPARLAALHSSPRAWAHAPCLDEADRSKSGAHPPVFCLR